MQKKHTQFLGNCPHCSTPLSKSRTSVVKNDADVVTFHTNCNHCKNSLLLTIQSGAPGLITTVGVPTDLVKKDIIRLKKRKRAITTDDVLELHAYLEKEK